MSNQPKRLYRSTQDRILGGVCAGLAEYFNVDATIMRLLYLAITLITGGICVILYIILWVIMPEKPQFQPEEQLKDNDNEME